MLIDTCDSGKRKAFTLIELLVVIAIIALLLAIIVPALKLTKEKASSIICMTNSKNLSLAWYSYKEDNNGEIMSAQMDGLMSDNGKRVSGWIGKPCDQAGNPLLIDQTTPEVTDADEIRGIEKGALHPYLKSPKVFNCPGDKVKSVWDKGEKFVTFAVPWCLYGYGSGSTLYNKQIKKFSDITSPSDRYNFVEVAEERNWIMHGHFAFGALENGFNPVQWWSPMAVNHGDSSVLGFCDGHAEIHKWQDSSTKERVKKLSALGTGNFGQYDPRPEGQFVDLEYVAKGWPYRHKP